MTDQQNNNDQQPQVQTITPEEVAEQMRDGDTLQIDARGRLRPRTARRADAEGKISLRKRRAWYADEELAARLAGLRDALACFEWRQQEHLQPETRQQARELIPYMLETISNAFPTIAAVAGVIEVWRLFVIADAPPNTFSENSPGVSVLREKAPGVLTAFMSYFVAHQRDVLAVSLSVSLAGLAPLTGARETFEERLYREVKRELESRSRLAGEFALSPSAQKVVAALEQLEARRNMSAREAAAEEARFNKALEDVLINLGTRNKSETPSSD